MWEERRGEGLDRGLNHSGHTWSSLRDELTCCRVRSLVPQKKQAKVYIKSTTPVGGNKDRGGNQTYPS